MKSSVLSEVRDAAKPVLFVLSSLGCSLLVVEAETMVAC